MTAMPTAGHSTMYYLMVVPKRDFRKRQERDNVNAAIEKRFGMRLRTARCLERLVGEIRRLKNIAAHSTNHNKNNMSPSWGEP